ncbi:protein mono-ADP-ribosyltransferase PARP14-like [Haliotis rubra]|uniref:protein mono-ADP-ribosyltransferase PARP14-like n=1 Tax=Haliotis rubra TaxID=36100 RepID=UPI001EE50154|nr:protein mono-ADP-ribosyltransferase PARP14-like [Haliotis rubra]
MSTRHGDHAAPGSSSPGPDTLQASDHPETVLCPDPQISENVTTVLEGIPEPVPEEDNLTYPSMSQHTSTATPGAGTHGRPETNPVLKLPGNDKKLVRKTVTISDEIDAMFLRSTKGRSYVDEVVPRNCCKILETAAGLEGAAELMSDTQVQPENMEWPKIPHEESEDNFRSRLASVRKPSPRKVELVTGSIAELKADVIVNSTNSELNLKAGAVSSSILQGAGSKLEKKLKKRYSKGFQDQTLIITKGYKLQCAQIYHVSLPNWNTSDVINKLKLTVTECLEEASKSKYARLLFPALGAGNLNYDKNTTARTIYETVNEFWKENPTTTLKSVTVVIYHGQQDVDKAFKEEHEACYGKPVKRIGRTLSVQGETEPDDDVARGVFFGNVRFTVVEGDILQQRVGLIVNGSNSKLDLSSGVLSNNLRKTFGKDLEKQCREKVGDIVDTGVAVTSVSGACFKAVLHYDPRFFNGISEVLPALLTTAEELNYTSLALPALDQGRRRGISKKKLAEHVFSSLTKHSGLRHLREVRMVIFQDHDLYNSLVSLFNNHACSATREDDVQPLGRQGTKDHETSTYEVTISSDSAQNLDKAIVELMSTPGIKQESFTKTCLMHLTVDKLRSLYDHAKTHSVGISVDRNHGVVTVKGFAEDVFNMMKRVYEICNELQASQIEAKAMQWYYIDILENGEQVKEKYDSDLNKDIELAFRNKAVEPLCKLTTEDGDRYVIDFNDMVEYREGNKDNTSVVVSRESVIKTLASDFDPPVSWERMNPDEDVLVVPLKKQDPQYSHVDTMFSVSKMEVVKIERIQNKTLYKQFAAKRTQLGVPETQLWHGTDGEAIPSINKGGFDRSYCGKHAAQFGNGVYFSTDPSYSTNNRFAKADSAGYKYIYLADVLIGQYTQGKKGMKVPPPIDPAKSDVRFNSVVDDVENPQKFVIFNDTQAYPKYLVTCRVVDAASTSTQ